MDGEGRGVMIRMAALIGMRHHDLSAGGGQLHGQAPRQPGEASDAAWSGMPSVSPGPSLTRRIAAASSSRRAAA
jgi:hypothetical protein